MHQSPNNRRAWLKQMSALGVMLPAGMSGLIQDVLAAGEASMASGIISATGNVMVNGKRVNAGAALKLGDRISTGEGKRSKAVVVIDKDAFLLRADTRVEFLAGSKPGALESVVLTAGKLLSVFAKRPTGERVNIRAQSATIGIRGTGCYLEIYPKRTYFCLCYGESSIEGGGMDAPRIINTRRHEQPVWLDESTDLMRIEPTEFGNHADSELIMLEKLTGRKPLFMSTEQKNSY